jgi:ABC-type antimicrobial peptide transport system permease subunit
MAGDTVSDDNLVHRAIKDVNPNLVVNEMESGETLIDRAEDSTRFSLLLLAIFAAIAGLLAGVGLYGVLSTAVRQRASEIGVRMALGARRENIFALVVGQGSLLSALGITAGIIAALVLTRLMSTMLVGVKPSDPSDVRRHDHGVLCHRGSRILPPCSTSSSPGSDDISS